MERAAMGCVEAGGVTVGILSGPDRKSANPHISISVPTGLGDGRNLLIIRSSDAVAAASGVYGSLSEIALALKANKPVIGLETWKDIPGVRYAGDPLEAVGLMTALLP